MRMRPPGLRPALAALAAAGLFASASASATVSTLPIQGMLADSTAVPVDAVDLPVTFRIWSAASGGSELHVEAAFVDVDDGHFTHMLGTGAPLDFDIFDGSDLWLGIQVASGTELTPRISFGANAYAAYAMNAAWSGLVGIPADIADGDQDTTYNAAFPLQRTGTTFGLATTGCVAGEAWVWNGSAWECTPTTAFTAGTGLSLAAGVLSADTAYLQRRVSGACASDSAIRQVAADGTVTCTEVLQRRVSTACPDGSAIKAINADGTISCETDDVGGGVTNVVAGSGITGGGSTPTVNLAINPTYVQRRVTGTCSGGNFVQAIAEDGTVTCVATPAAPTYTAGAGLSLAAGAFSVNPTYVQRRLTNNCPANQYMYGVEEDGDPLCRPDVDTDSNTTYTFSNGVTASGTAVSVDFNTVQRRVGATICPYGISSIDGSGNISCAANNAISYSGGTGIILSGTSFSADTTYLQRRLSSHDCTGGIRTIDGAGNVTCAGDANTTYSAGDGLTLSGTQFLVNTSVQRTAQFTWCQYGIARISQNGAVECAANNDTNTWPTGFRNCPDANYWVYGINGDGSPNCRHAKDYVNTYCVTWIGWSDVNRWCCDHLQHSSSNAWNQGGFGQRRIQYWDGSWGHVQGVRFSGGVDDNDWIWSQLRCF